MPFSRKPTRKSMLISNLSGLNIGLDCLIKYSEEDKSLLNKEFLITLKSEVDYCIKTLGQASRINAEDFKALQNYIESLIELSNTLEAYYERLRLGGLSASEKLADLTCRAAGVDF